MMSTTDENTWRTQGFRQSMVNKIQEAITHCGAPTSKNAIEMEIQVFSKAKSKDEYLSFVARLIIHIKEMGSKKVAGMAGQQNPGQGGILPQQMSGPQQQQNMGMMNPMNQMGNMNMMGSQGMVPMNPNQSSMMQAMAQQPQQQQLLAQQQLNQQPNNANQMGNMNIVHQQQQQQQQQQQGMGVPMNPNQSSIMQAMAQQNLLQQQQQQQQSQQSMMNQQNFMQQQHATMQNDHMRNTQMGGAVQLGNQMGTVPMNPQGGGPGDNQIRTQLQNSQQQQQMNPQMHPQIPGGQIPTSSMQQQLIQQQQQQPQQGGGRMVGRMMGPQSAMAMAKGPQQRNIHRAPNVPNVPNVHNMPNQFTGPNTGPLNRAPSQYIGPSPVQGNIGQTLSPGPQPNQNPNYLTQSTLMPSPAAPGMTNNLRSFQGHGVPSPGSSLNTPLMAVSTPSPRNSDDQACIDKIRELQKYTDLLQRMIAKFGNDDVEKSSKMKKLLEILTNPNQRVSMEILLKCEVALRKMERQQNDPGGVLGPTPQPPPMKDQSQVSPFQQVLDALAGALRAPSSSHTLLRTFRPTVEALTGHSFGACFQNYEEDEPSSDSESTENDIPSILKRELRSLDSHFKVSIFRRGGGMVRLRVKVDLDPRVPPLKINVRSDYPYDPPVVVHLARDYGSTAFLKAVGRTYKSRFVRLTPNHTVTELLFLWHSSISHNAMKYNYKKSS